MSSSPVPLIESIQTYLSHEVDEGDARLIYIMKQCVIQLSSLHRNNVELEAKLHECEMKLYECEATPTQLQRQRNKH